MTDESVESLGERAPDAPDGWSRKVDRHCVEYINHPAPVGDDDGDRVVTLTRTHDGWSVMVSAPNPRRGGLWDLVSTDKAWSPTDLAAAFRTLATVLESAAAGDDDTVAVCAECSDPLDADQRPDGLCRTHAANYLRDARREGE